MRSWFARRASDERGAVLVVVSIASVVMLGATALAVDVGQLTTNNRDLQATADVIALDAVRVLGSGLNAVQAAAEDSAERNDFPADQVTVELGTKTSGSGFVVNPVSPNAVRIIAHGEVDFSFAPGSGTSSRSAVAVQSKKAGFSVGSFLAAIPAGGNTVLAQIFGEEFGLSLVNYDGLANANVTLEAIGLNMPVAMTPTQLVGASINMRDFLLASVDAVNPNNTAAINLLNAMAANVPAGQLIDLGRTIDIETGAESAAADASLNLLQILTANALAADGTHTINIPSAALNLPGIGSVQIALTVTQPAKTVFGEIGTYAETAQVSATVTPTINLSTGPGSINICSIGNVLQGLLQSLFSINILQLAGCILGILNIQRVVSLDLTASLPITVQAVGARGTLTGIDCGDPKRMQLTPTFQPVTLTGSANVGLTGSLLGTSLGNIAQLTGTLNTQVTGSAPAAWYDETQFGQKHSVGSQSLGLGSTHPMTFSSVTVLNTNLANPLNTVTGTLGSLLNAALATVGTSLLEPLSHLLGLNLFGADLTPLKVKCNGVQLVE